MFILTAKSSGTYVKFMHPEKKGARGRLQLLSFCSFLNSSFSGTQIKKVFRIKRFQVYWLQQVNQKNCIRIPNNNTAKEKYDDGYISLFHIW